MTKFQDLNLSKPLFNALIDLGFESPTPIQEQAFSVVLSGKNVVGIAQTGTGKTLAYLLPILRDLKFSKQLNPRVIILVPTRELVLQVVQVAEELANYMNVRIKGVYGGTNINTQKQNISLGVDILVGTPGRLYDLALSGAVSLKGVGKLVIDEVDVMLDLGFLFQLTNIFELLPDRRQNIMFSATMTEEVDSLIDDFFIAPTKIAIAVSGTPLENISQTSYLVKNFYTKANLLNAILQDQVEYKKVLIFVSSKKRADLLFSTLEEAFGESLGIIHSNKSQNYRIKSITQFDEGIHRILISTDIMARGLDLDRISHVINFDTPIFPENYMHRIGRTGRAEEEGNSILLTTELEAPSKVKIESLMQYKIPVIDFPEHVELSHEYLPDEKPDVGLKKHHNRNERKVDRGPAVHEKKDKNKKVNLGGSYRRDLAKKYKKSQTRGDKRTNNRKKKR